MSCLLCDKEIINKDVYCVDISSTSNEEWSHLLCPCFIGPIDIYPLDDKFYFTSLNLENAWKYLGVAKKFIDENKNPTNEYMQWAFNGWIKEQNNNESTEPIYYLWKGQYIGNIEARFKIFAPLYVDAVLKYAYKSFVVLKEIYNKYGSLIIYDGYNYYNINSEIDFENILYDSKQKFNYIHILAMMLTNNLIYEEPFNQLKIIN